MYNVIHKESGTLKLLRPDQINDMFEDALGRIVVSDIDLELYWLLASVDLLEL